MKCIASFFAGFLLAAACGAAEAPNAADVYRRAFEALPKLTDAESNLLRGQPSDVNPVALSRKLAPALAEYRQAARMENCDWGLDFAKTGLNTMLPHLSPLRQLSNAAAWEADRVKQSDPSAFAAWHEDVLRSSAHAGQGDALICGLVEASMRQRSVNAISTNLATLPPDVLAKLGERLATLPQMPSFQKMMLAEKTFGIDWLMRRLFELQREQQAAEAATNFAATLRLSAVVDGGPLGLKIGLEENGGDNFWLGLGQRKHGIELVSADVKKGQAVLLKGNQAALVLLQEKRIEPISLKLFIDEWKRVFGMDETQTIIKAAGSNSTQLVRQLMETSDLMNTIAASAVAPAKDPEAWGKAIEEELGKKGNIFATAFLPAIGGARARMDATRAQDAMLRVAVDVAREGPAAAARSRDPWGDGAPFVCRETPDGYELISQLRRKGENVTLRFPRR
ncbi:MAG: hypothetical protein NTY53_08520 [Kiritimatiellaeota bacterium]|nr:hypothetical protein [Kiritimatiellota bacterium]